MADNAPSRRALLTGLAALPVAASAAAAERRSKRRKPARPKVQHVDVAVIGAGVFGAWTAWHLVRAGKSVRMFDAYGAGHWRASSGGESRVIRMGYGADAIYSQMARDSLEYWKDLSDSASAPIFHKTGVLWFAPEGDRYTAQSRAWLHANDVPHQVGDVRWLQEKYRQIQFYQGETGLLETESGALIAGRGVQEVIADARIEVERVVMPAPLFSKRIKRHTLPDGGTADHLVYACGPWIAELFPQQLMGRIVATRQEIYHFGAPQGDTRFAPPELPVWADFNNGRIVYGIPDIEGAGFKIAFDTHGPVVDPDTMDRSLTPAGIAAARAYVARRFPGLADAPLIGGRVCQYENSSNGDYLIDRFPGQERVWLVGGGSGHGFKNGPAVGKRVAAHILDKDLAIEPRFSFASKGTVAGRTVF
ncbi:FAD-dependent oxidoreductase [Sphingopyxis sp. XHP0097]|uniref:FAD-dependent oxidoreductase n=1 Tax=Sphingopyxis jiangsuensis TaxID=2871171 RepID=A0ABS7MGL7_9SPHN|nr:FAD-dependent oxidoreductase [Sphingopyxis jiangsuensis]MBY4638172.1 FAD-dependent oxidoreductase [Sphingopyxis jiangsuensis]